MRWMLQSLVVIVTLALAASGCLNIKAVTIGQKTALERQLAGTYEELDDELALVASVRGPNLKDSDAKAVGDLEARALAARRRQLFNQDDVVELKRLGCLGETSVGRVMGRPCQAARDDAAVAGRIDRMVRQENDDRVAIINLALMLDSMLTPKDREALQRVYARMMLHQALPGTWVQSAEGDWTQVR